MTTINDPYIQTSRPASKLLSVLLFGSNDNYQGNYTWRLGVALNKLVHNLRVLNALDQVEILIADWASANPLWKDLELSPDARTHCKFMLVPQGVAGSVNDQVKQRVAANALALRAAGKYLLYTDSDHFLTLESTANLLFHLRKGYFEDYDLAECFFTASRKNVPFELVSTSPYLEDIDNHITAHNASYQHEKIDRAALKCTSHTLLLNRELWYASTGWNENVGSKEASKNELQQRLLQTCRWNDLEHYGVKFYHLEHRTTQPQFSAPAKSAVEFRFKANTELWGLREHKLEWIDGRGLALDPVSKDSASKHEVIKLTELAPKSIAEIVTTNAAYSTIAERFPFDPGSWFSNANQVTMILNQLKPAVVCEVGSWLGASARHFAKHPSVQKLYCVDHWDRERVENYEPGGMPEETMNNIFEKFMANAVHEGVADKIYPIRRSSQEAIEYCRKHQLKFDLIYIDGEHSTRGVERDLNLWMPFLKDTGFICGDDWTWQEEPDNVAGAVMNIAAQRKLSVLSEGNFWIMVPPSVANAQTAATNTI